MRGGRHGRGDTLPPWVPAIGPGREWRHPGGRTCCRLRCGAVRRREDRPIRVPGRTRSSGGNRPSSRARRRCRNGGIAGGGWRRSSASIGGSRSAFVSAPRDTTGWAGHLGNDRADVRRQTYHGGSSRPLKNAPRGRRINRRHRISPLALGPITLGLADHLLLGTGGRAGAGLRGGRAGRLAMLRGLSFLAMPLGRLFLRFHRCLALFCAATTAAQRKIIP